VLCHSFVNLYRNDTDWSLNISDPSLQDNLCEVIRAYAKLTTPAVYDSLLYIALPQLGQLLSQQAQNDESRQQVESAIVVLNAICDARPSPIGDGFFDVIGQALFTILSRTDDDNVLQEGIECLTYVVRKDIGQLMNW
jgi:hypothetical protein